MDTLQCAVILAKLDTFDWEVEQRIRIGRIYRDMVAEIPGIQAPIVRNDRTCVWAQFTIQTDRREEIVQSLKEVGRSDRGSLSRCRCTSSRPTSRQSALRAR